MIVSSRTITLIRLDGYIGVPRFRLHVFGLTYPFPIFEVLARLLSRSRVSFYDLSAFSISAPSQSARDRSSRPRRFSSSSTVPWGRNPSSIARMRTGFPAIQSAAARASAIPPDRIPSSAKSRRPASVQSARNSPSSGRGTIWLSTATFTGTERSSAVLCAARAAFAPIRPQVRSTAAGGISGGPNCAHFQLPPPRIFQSPGISPGSAPPFG